MPNNSQLLNLLYSQQGDLNNLYNATARELAVILKRYNLKSKTNIWIGNKALEKDINSVLSRFNVNLKNHININIEKSWNLSNVHNDNLVKNYTKGINIPDALKANMMQRNEGALKAFVERKKAGFKLSDRVWNLTNTTKSQIESYLQTGIADGSSAVRLTKDLRQYLKNPNKRFRRLRNAKGKLVLSNPAKDFHPGRGVYRSSFKNALRLARNETNIAYRSADHLRRMQLPFVIGIDVHLSNAHPNFDICDELQGEYPKNFKFYAWHANCICYTTNKLLPKNEFIKHLNGGNIKIDRYTAKIPNRAQAYLNSTSKTIKGYKNKPYFIADNFKNTKEGFALKNNVNPFIANKNVIKTIEMPSGEKRIVNVIKYGNTNILIPKNINKSYQLLSENDLKRYINQIPVEHRGAIKEIRLLDEYFFENGKAIKDSVATFDIKTKSIEIYRNSRFESQDLEKRMANAIRHESGHVVEDLITTKDPQFLKDWAKAIKDDRAFISDYAKTDIYEDIAETLMNYWSPDRIERRTVEMFFPERFKILKKYNIKIGGN